MPDHNDRPTAPLLYTVRLHTPGPDGAPLCGAPCDTDAVLVPPGSHWAAHACRDCAHHAVAILAQPVAAPPTRAQIDGAIWSALRTWLDPTRVHAAAHTVTDAVMALITPETPDA